MRRPICGEQRKGKQSEGTEEEADGSRTSCNHRMLNAAWLIEDETGRR